MVCGTDADVRLGTKQEGIVLALVKNAFQNGKIQLACVQHREQMRGVVHQKIQFMRRIAQKAADLREEDVIADRLGCADAKTGLRCSVECAEQLGIVVAKADGIALKQLALRCFGELPAVIAEQSDAVIRLKRLDLLADCGLAEVEPLCGAAIVQRLAEGEKCLQFLLHRCLQ